MALLCHGWVKAVMFSALCTHTELQICVHWKVVCYIADGHKALLANCFRSEAARELARPLSWGIGLWFIGVVTTLKAVRCGVCSSAGFISK